MSTEGSAARTCIFCGATIPPGDPGEHVYSKWLSKFLEKGELFTHMPGYFKETTHAESEPWGQWAEYQSRDTGAQVRTVCRACNHHWMSDLESETSPILTPMIEGKPQGLNIEQQLLVSRWATKTAMVLDELVPREDRLFSREEHHWLKDDLVPPPDTTVRLGHYIGTRAEFIEHKRVALFWDLPEPGRSIDPDAHRTVIVVGKCVIELAVRAPPLLPGSDFALDDVLMPIWPTAEVRAWPPRDGITDKTLESLHSPSEPD